MNKNDIEIIISHLSGFIRGAEFIDSSLLTSVVMSEFSMNNIKQSLLDYYENLMRNSLNDDQKYKFDNVKKINFKELQSSMENFYFQNPFENKNLMCGDILNNKRFNFVFMIIDLINMIREEYGNLDFYCSQMLWFEKKAIYSGNIYIFPLQNNNAILLKVVRKKE